ncbi:MAG TPA: hypothetical protein VF796_19575, partial [Humisphaera sp.]
MKKLLVCAAVVGAVGVASTARAVPVAYDGFESYAAGAGLSGGSAGNGSTGPNGEFGWTSNWTAVSGVNVQSAAPVGSRTGQLDATPDSVVAATRSFTPQSGTAVYFSLRYNPAAGLDGSDFVHFYLGNSGTTNSNTGGIGDIDTTLTTLGARIGTTNGGTTVNSGTATAQGTTYLLVGKLSKVSSTNFNRVDLFVNPAGTTEPATPDATQTGDAGIAQLSTFSVRAFNLDAGDAYKFDDVRIGTAFGDVVPEPT